MEQKDMWSLFPFAFPLCHMESVKDYIVSDLISMRESYDPQLLDNYTLIEFWENVGNDFPLLSQNALNLLRSAPSSISKCK